MSFEASETVTQEFFEYLVASHSLGHDGFHGREHWLRVLQNAREIAAETGANLRVLELFAVLHDSRRENENHDPEHGHRAAAYAVELRGKWFDLADDEMDLLIEACRFHSEGMTEAHLTVQACWDADRLDLGRVGVRPSPRFLCTTYAQRPEVINAAYLRSVLVFHEERDRNLHGTGRWRSDCGEPRAYPISAIGKSKVRTLGEFGPKLQRKEGRSGQ